MGVLCHGGADVQRQDGEGVWLSRKGAYREMEGIKEERLCVQTQNWILEYSRAHDFPGSEEPSACFAMRSDSKQLKEAVRDVPGNYRLQTRWQKGKSVVYHVATQIIGLNIIEM